MTKTRKFTIIVLLIAAALTAINVWTLFEGKRVESSTESWSASYEDQKKGLEEKAQKWLDNLDEDRADLLTDYVEQWCDDTNPVLIQRASYEYAPCEDIPNEEKQSACVADTTASYDHVAGLPEDSSREDYCRVRFNPNETDQNRIDKEKRDIGCMTGTPDDCDGEVEKVCRENGVPAEGNWVGDTPRVPDCWYKPNTGSGESPTPVQENNSLIPTTPLYDSSSHP